MTGKNKTDHESYYEKKTTALTHEFIDCERLFKIIVTLKFSKFEKRVKNINMKQLKKKLDLSIPIIKKKN